MRRLVCAHEPGSRKGGDDLSLGEGVQMFGDELLDSVIQPVSICLLTSSSAETPITMALIPTFMQHHIVPISIMLLKAQLGCVVLLYLLDGVGQLLPGLVDVLVGAELCAGC